MMRPVAHDDFPDAEHDDHRRGEQASLLIALGVIFVVVVSVLAWRTVLSPATPGSPGAVACRLDPNRAPWWELAQLPGIGEVTAKAIVARRQAAEPRTASAQSVYRTIEDLQAVKGIGPKRAAALRDHLLLPDGT